MIFCARLAAICGIWTDKIATVLGSHTATVDHESDRFGRGRGTGSQRQNERAVDRAQAPRRTPPSHPSPQGGTADKLGGRGERSPSPLRGQSDGSSAPPSWSPTAGDQDPCLRDRVDQAGW